MLDSVRQPTLLVRSMIAFGFIVAADSDAADATNDYAAAVVICMVQRSIRYCLLSNVLTTASCGCPQRAVNAENEKPRSASRARTALLRVTESH